MERTDPGFLNPERPMLEQWLEYHRETLAWKCEGLSAEQLRARSVPPSTMSLLGLVRHMAEVERNWFRRCFSGEDAPPHYYSDDDPDGDFVNVDAADVDEAFATWNAECDASRTIADGRSLDDTGMWYDQVCSLRWIYFHMIEEYARHNGHADLIRQCIDGAVGD